MIKAFRCTKFNTISAPNERRRVVRKRDDFIWMATQTRHIRPGGPGRGKEATHKTDSAAPKVTPAKGKSKAKGKGKSGQSATINDPVLSAMARLTLQSAQQHRVWEASLLTTYLGQTDSAVITSMRESGVRYHQETQTSDAARRAQLGPPHVHVFGAMIGALVTQISTITWRLLMLRKGSV